MLGARPLERHCGAADLRLNTLRNASAPQEFHHQLPCQRRPPGNQGSATHASASLRYSILCWITRPSANRR
jgi:hypothetical protein